MDYMGVEGGEGFQYLRSDLDAPTAVVRYSMHGAGGIQGLDLRSAGDGGWGDDDEDTTTTRSS